MRSPALALLMLLASGPLAGNARAVELVVRGGDGALWLVPDSGPARSLGGAILGTPGAALRGGRLEVVVRGTDDALWTIARDDGRWGSFERVGGAISAAPAATWRGDVLEVVARGSDGACWRVSRGASGWGAWESLGGAFPDRATFGIASRGEGSLDVFGRGQDALLWHSQLGSRGWSGFQSMGGDALGSDPAACVRGGGIDVVALAADRSAQVLSWTPSGGWGRWASLGGTFAAGSALGVASWGPQHLVVAGIGTDDRAWIDEMNGARWDGWHPVGDGRPASSATPVATVADIPGTAPLQPISAPPVSTLPMPTLRPAETLPVAQDTRDLPRTLGGSSARSAGTDVAVDPSALAAAASPVAAVPSVEARALVDLDPSQLVVIGRPRGPQPHGAIELSPETLARLGHAADAPFPGCSGDAPCVRVSLLGFRLLDATGDPADDGPGDEVALRADAWWSADEMWWRGEPMMRESLVYGSRRASASGREAQRVRAGSASAHGGLARGDAHPARLPDPSSAQADRRLPMVVFEGPLSGRAALRIALSAWEVDTGAGPADCCASWSATSVADDVRNGLGESGVPVTVPLSRIERVDRPYGLFVLDPSERSSFAGAEALATVALLGDSLADWRTLAARTGLHGTGVVPIEFSDSGRSARLVAFVHVAVHD